MSGPQPGGTLLNFEPDFEATARPAPESSFFWSVAMPWAKAGWPVLPIDPAKGRATRAGTMPSSDLAVVRGWASKPRYRDLNVGVVINGLRVVVFDIDDERGVESLTDLLITATETLPDTYSETTGKQAGRHILLRLPANVPPLVGQYANHYPDTPALDVLFNGHFVAAGSIHRSGRRYEAQGPIPRWEDLAELPLPLYDLLRARGKVDSKHLPSPECGPERQSPARSSQSLARDRPSTPSAPPRGAFPPGSRGSWRTQVTVETLALWSW